MASQNLSSRISSLLSPLAAIVLILTLIFIAPGLDRYALQYLTLTLMWVALASSWNLIGGYAGYTDFGHAIFVGVGAYAAGILIARDESLILSATLSFPQALIAAFIIGALFALVIGFPTLRLKGAYFAIAMLGMLAMTREIVRNATSVTQGGVGITFPSPFPQMLEIYYVMLIVASAIFLTSLWIFRSQLGTMLQAIAQDEIAADMRGINTTTVKIGIFMLVGGFTALIGATRAYWLGYANPNLAFPEDFTIQMIMITLLGGIGRPWGPVIGGVIFLGAQSILWTNGGEVHLIVMSALLIMIALFFPRGILGLFDPKNRGLKASSRGDTLPSEKSSLILSMTDTLRAWQTPSTTRPLLEGHNITRDFGGIRAINKINFQIQQGEIVGLLGPNGSGKTTLFDCISGILKPSSGELFLNGEDITQISPWRVNRYGLARTFQNIRVFEGLTVYENMLASRKWRGVPLWTWMWSAPPETRQHADEFLAFLGLSSFSQLPASSLSGGQQRLLEIGMTLMSNPLVVLIDEATSGINPSMIEDIKTSILRLNQELGLTFFLIEHNRHFAMDLCHRLYVLNHGALIAEGTPEEIQNNPAVIEAYFGRETS